MDCIDLLNDCNDLCDLPNCRLEYEAIIFPIFSSIWDKLSEF